MKKIEFYTMVRDNNKVIAKKQTGWTDGKWFYYKASEKLWYAIDPNCGISIGYGSTLKDCVQCANGDYWLVKFADLKRNYPDVYQNWCEDFKIAVHIAKQN